MMTLKFPQPSAELEEIEEALKQLSLAFRKEQDPALQYLVLEDGESIVKGPQEIKNHLDNLRDELPKWWFCGC